MDASRERAKKLVEFWNRRGWVTDGAPLHVHPLDLVKLEELIARELSLDENRAPGKAAV